MNKKEKGITLIALVITIIILLVLSAVNIALLMGENGLIKKAKDAVEKNHDAVDKEKLALTLQTYQISKYENSKTESFVDAIRKEEWCRDASYDDLSKNTTLIFKECGHIYRISESGETEKMGTMSSENMVSVNTLEGLEYFISKDGIEKIFLESDIEISKKIIIKSGKNIAVHGSGNYIKYADSYDGTLFHIESNASLTFDNTNFDGENSWTWNNTELNIAIEKSKAGQSIYIDDSYPSIVLSKGRNMSSNIFYCEGNLTLSNNSKIINWYSYTPEETNIKNNIIRAMGTEENKPTITLSNTKIYHCVGSVGLVAYLSNANIQINDDTQIYDNYCYTGDGGIFDLEGKSDAIINNGQFLNNVAIARRGMVFYANGSSSVVMNNGVISGNIALRSSSSASASMIECVHQGTFTMNGGSIINNTGLLAGAISVRWPDSADKVYITLNKGVIKDNSVHIPNSWNNPTALFTRGAAVISEGMIVNGNVTVNDTNGLLTNNGTIIGNVSVTHSSAIAVNNGTIDGDVNVITGTINNNGIVTGTITTP